MCYLAVVFVAFSFWIQGSEFGGSSLIKSEATGFFRAEQIEGVWWIIDPSGFGFISKGVSAVRYEGDESPKLGYSRYLRTVESAYPSRSAWAKNAVERLKEWGFNSIGSWSTAETYQHKIAYTHNLNIGVEAGGNWLQGDFPDVFSEKFQETADAVAARECAPRRNDAYLLGYFSDNELKWGADWRSEQGLLADYWSLAAGSAGRQAAVEFMKAAYQGSIGRFNTAWMAGYENWSDLLELSSLGEVGPHVSEEQGKIRHNLLMGMVTPALAIQYLKVLYPSVEALNKDRGTNVQSFEEFVRPRELSDFGKQLQVLEERFSGLVARRYFQVCASAIRKHDPNHLILGCRFASYAPERVVSAMGGDVDVVTFNNYDFLPPYERLADLNRWSGRPVILTEFSFKAMDSGLPNTRGAGVPVPTQKDRADHFERYVTALMQMPFMVGFHWFRYIDEPAEGRFDGENSNYGLVDVDDKPWEVLTTRMSELNPGWEAIHQGSAGKQ